MKSKMLVQRIAPWGYGLLLLGLAAAPFLGAYPLFVMKLLCFALFASAFNLLLGYTGLLSFGHAAFLGGAAYMAGQSIKAWGLTPELGMLLGMATGESLAHLNCLKERGVAACEADDQGVLWWRAI